MASSETTPCRRPGVLRRFGFRFVTAYLLIYNAGPILMLLPFVGRYAYLIDLGWNQAVFWVERDILHAWRPCLSSLQITGSGDTSFLWVRNGCMLALALATGLAWSFP